MNEWFTRRNEYHVTSEMKLLEAPAKYSKIDYEESNLLCTTERDVELFVTFRESTIRKTFTLLPYFGP